MTDEPTPLPRPRVPMSARRCTCSWDMATRQRVLADPFCPAQVLHSDPTDEEVTAAVQRALADGRTSPLA